MFELDTPSGVTHTDDGFELADGAQRVTPDVFRANAPSGVMVINVITEALADAAAADGSLLNFDIRSFYDTRITAAAGISSEDPPLRYDAFASMTLTEAFMRLRYRGYLALRGNGDSYDYWLACPAS